MAGLMDILNFVKARIGDNEVEEASEKIYYNNPGNIETGQGYAG